MTAPMLDRVLVADLDAIFAQVLPCGGNLTPVERPCPDGAPATLVSICHPVDPQDYKCNKCHAEWLSAAIAEGFVYGECDICRGITPVRECYQSL